MSAQGRMLRQRVPRRQATAPSSRRGKTFDFEDCKQAHAKIKELDADKLCRVGEVSTIPYMGIGPPPERPGGDIEFYSIFEVEEFLEFMQTSVDPEVYVFGCKGIGKSCLLRAIACGLIKDRKANERIVCIWNMEAAFRDLTAALRDALLFTYCLEDNHVSAIRQIQDLKGIKAFISERKEQGERFVFILDGAQCLDTHDSSGKKRLDSHERLRRKEELYSIMILGERYISVLSPIAADAAVECKRKQRENYFEMRGGFVQEVYEAYINNAALGGVLESNPDRINDIDYLAGSHAMSLARLSDVILEHIRSLDANAQTLKRTWTIFSTEDCVSFSISREEVAQRFRHESEWLAVKQKFTATVMRMKPSIVRIVEKFLAKENCGRYFSVEEMMQADPRYVIAGQEYEPDQYCTPLIHRIYVEAFREAQRARYSHGPWLDYCKYLLEHPRGVVWSSMGWLCQHVVEDILCSEQGLQLGSVRLQRLRLLLFTTVPLTSAWQQMLDKEGQSGVICLPRDCCHPLVDGVIIWRRKVGANWEYHFHGLQLTVNHARHMHSATEFMHVTCVQEWIPDILPKRNQWNLHYTFLSTSDQQATEVPAVLRKLTSTGEVVGTLAHTLEVYTFSSALRHCIDGEAATTLQRITGKRASEAATLRVEVPSRALATVISHLTQAALLRLAVQEGVGAEICDNFKRRKIDQSVIVNELMRKLEEKDGLEDMTLHNAI